MELLLLVAHPDDDAIFAGALQARLAKHRWHVACLTARSGSRRGRELVRWQRSLGTPRDRLYLLGERDDPEDLRRGRTSIPLSRLCRRLEALALRPDLVVTHNARGEYGHPHHVLVHRAAARVYEETPRLEFARGSEPSDLVLPGLGKWPRALRCYRSQWHILALHARPTERFRWSPESTRAVVSGLSEEDRIPPSPGDAGGSSPDGRRIGSHPMTASLSGFRPRSTEGPDDPDGRLRVRDVAGGARA